MAGPLIFAKIYVVILCYILFVRLPTSNKLTKFGLNVSGGTVDLRPWIWLVVKVRYWSFIDNILYLTLYIIDSRWCHWGFFPWYPLQNHVPWGRLSLWKWVPGISPGIKAAGAFSWRPTTIVVPKRQEIRGLNRPGTPWATSACSGRLLLTLPLYIISLLMKCETVGMVQNNLIVSFKTLKVSTNFVDWELKVAVPDGLVPAKIS